MSRRSLTTFVLLLCFGILFAGCSAPAEQDEFVFTDEDLQQVYDSDVSSSMSSTGPVLAVDEGTGDTVLSAGGSMGIAGGDTTTYPVDEEKARLYDGIRTAVFDQGANVYRVNNAFLNVRSSMDVSSTQVRRLVQGDVVTVVEIPNAGWAKVLLADGAEGYVALRYIAKLTTEDRLPEEKKKFEGQYFVDYQFLNVRKEPSTQAEKIAELPGQSIVRPVSMSGEWARVVAQGKEGYVSTQYLRPFQPSFLVRQDSYPLPILQVQADDTGSVTALPKHVAALKAAGMKLVTLRTLTDTVLAQESRDVRISPHQVVLAITGVSSANIRAVSDALQAAGAPATLFIETKDLGMTGITEKTVLTLLANGHELQSGGHTGDDLRSMTDAQVSLELAQSKKLLEDITKREVTAIAYPAGGINDRIMGRAAGLAYLFGLTQSPDRTYGRSQFLRLPSLMISAGMSPEDVVKLVR